MWYSTRSLFLLRGHICHCNFRCLSAMHAIILRRALPCYYHIVVVVSYLPRILVLFLVKLTIFRAIDLAELFVSLSLLWSMDMTVWYSTLVVPKVCVVAILLVILSLFPFL